MGTPMSAFTQDYNPVFTATVDGVTVESNAYCLYFREQCSMDECCRFCALDEFSEFRPTLDEEHKRNIVSAISIRI